MKKRRLTIVIWILSMFVALGAGVFALMEDCVHDWGEWTTVTESTCSQAGVKIRKCTRCRETEEAELEKLPHTLGTSTVTKQATCLEDGVKTTKCKVCNQVAKTEPIKAVGYHTFVEDYAKRENATCVTNGSKTYVCTECNTVKKETIKAVGHHSWDDATPTWIDREATEANCETEGATAHKECTRCGAKNEDYVLLEPKHPLTPVEFDEGEPMICSENKVGYTPGRQCPECQAWVEGHEVIPVEHVYEEDGWVTKVESTCTVQGQATQICLECHKEQTKSLPLLNHSYTKNVAAQQPTCVQNGWTAHRVCENCNKPDSSYQVLEKVGHYFDDFGFCKVEKCTAYTYEFKYYGKVVIGGETVDAYVVSKLVVGENDTRSEFLIPSVTPNGGVVVGIGASACEGLQINHNFIVTLPDTVTFIEESAFENCSKLVAIQNVCNDQELCDGNCICSSLESIGKNAFEGCSALNFIRLNNVKTIGERAFKDCTSLEEIVLAEEVQSVGYMAFKGCTNLKSLTVPYIGSVENDENTFGYIFGSNSDVTTRLTKVVVLKADKVSAGAFEGIGSLQEIVLPATVTEIEENAFRNCTSLWSVRFVEEGEVEVVPEETPEEGDGLDELANIDGLEDEENSVVLNFNNFTQITKIGKNAFENVKFAKIVLPFIGSQKNDGQNTNIGYAFGDENEDLPESLKEIYIANAKSVVDYAFAGCQFVEKIELPAEVREIGESAFNGCSALKEVVYPAENVVKMGVLAFAGCDSLETLTIPFIGGVENDEFEKFGYLFANTDDNEGIPESLKTVVVLRGETVAVGTFEGCADIVYLTIPEVDIIGANAFKGCSSLKEIRYGETGEKNYLPETIVSIGKSAFEGCFAEGFKDSYDFELGEYVKETVSLTLPFIGLDKNVSKTTSINEYGEESSDETIGYIFGGNKNLPVRLTEIILLDGAQGEKEIAVGAFAECVYLESVTISNYVQIIKEGAFEDCTGLKSIVIPGTIQTIEFGAFEGCTSVETISLPFVGGSRTAESGEQHFGWIFGINTSGMHQLESTKMPTEVSVVLDGATQLLNSAFYEYEGLKSITIPSTLTKLDSEVFMLCKNLETVEFVLAYDENGEEIPWALTEIGSFAFRECESLKEIELPESVEKLGANSFELCSSLERVVTQGNNRDALIVREIGFATFRNSFKAQSGSSYPWYPSYGSSVVVRIEGLDVMGTRAFMECNATEIYINAPYEAEIPEDDELEDDELEGTNPEDGEFEGGELEGTNPEDGEFEGGELEGTNPEDGELEDENPKVELIIPEGNLKQIGEYTFNNCKSLTTLVLPDSIEEINTYAMTNCVKLTNFKMPKSINYIGGYAFSNAEEFVAINENGEEVLEFNKSIYIDSYAFENCVKLTELVFTFDLDVENPETVTIALGAFSGCTNLEWVYLPYNNMVGESGTVDVGVVTIGSKAFAKCGITLTGGMYIYYNFDLTGDGWNNAWHESANLGKANCNLKELEDLNGDEKVDYADYKIAKAIVQWLTDLNGDGEVDYEDYVLATQDEQDEIVD